MNEINNRPALLKALALIDVLPLDITGAGQTLEVTFGNDADYLKFVEKVAPWPASGTQWGGWIARKSTPYRPGSEHDFNDRASCHHY